MIRLVAVAIISMLLGSCAKEVCPGEVQVRNKATPIKTSTSREIRNMAKPSLIFSSKSSGGRKPPKSSTVYTAETNRKPPKSTIYTSKTNSARRPPK